MRVVTAPDFRALRAALPGEIAQARGNDALAPVTVVTPSDLAREETRRDLAARSGGTFGVTVVGWAGWIAEAARPALAETFARRLPDPGFERLVARIAEETGRRGPLASAHGTPGLSRALTASLGDLLEGGHTPETVVVPRGDRSDPVRAALAAALAALHEAMDGARLADRRREEGLAAGAMARAAESGVRGAPLLLFGFHDLTPRQRAAVLAARASRPVGLLVPGPDGAGGVAAGRLVDWARARGATLESLDSGDPVDVTLLPDAAGGVRIADPGGDRLELVEYACESDEARGIARRIRRDVRAADRPFRDFLVVVPPSGPSPGLFRRVFRAAGIPLADRAGVPADRTFAGMRALVLAEALAAHGPGPELDALAFLPEPERDGPTPDVEDHPFTAAQRARHHAEACQRFRILHAHRFGEPPPESVEAALRSIELALGARAARPRDFAAALRAALGSVRDRASEDDVDAGDAVLLVRVDQARGVDRPVVFHAGLVEGALRRVPAEDPLLPDAVRELLNDAHEHAGLGLRRREDARTEAILLARFALECSTERAVLSWARRERPGADERNPSGLWADLAAARGGSTAAGPPDPDAALDPWDEDLARFGDGRAGEDDLAAVLAVPRAARLLDALRQSESRWRAGVLTRHDGVLRDARTRRLVARKVSPERRPWSATALESAAGCPFAFLVERVLRLQPPRDRDDDFDPLDRGALFHQWLETVYSRLHRDGVLPLRPEHLPACLAMLDDVVEQHRVPLRREPPARAVLRQATLAVLRDDVAAVLAHDAHLPPGERTVPVRFEFRFGRDDPASAPRFPLGGDRRLPLQGTVDRLDRQADGRLQVVDFKTGAPRVRDGRIARTVGGRTTVSLQLPLYIDAVERALGEPVAGACFWHATVDHDFARVSFPRERLDALRPLLARLLTHVLDRAEAGWFPSLPGEECCSASLGMACGASPAARFRRKACDPDLVERLARLAEAAEAAP